MLVNIHQAKTHFSRLVTRAAAGEEIVIGRAGVPVAKLVAYKADEAEPAPSRIGFWKGRVSYSDDWDSPETNAEIERLFYGDDEGEEADQV
ncbi:MAG: type II toxin-antitoxin system Phd/YefM family antitoxin [Acidimicrobiales bacterium]